MWLPADNVLDPQSGWSDEENIDDNPETYGVENSIKNHSWGDFLIFFPPATVGKEGYYVMPCCGIRFDAQRIFNKVNKISISAVMPFQE